MQDRDLIFTWAEAKFTMNIAHVYVRSGVGGIERYIEYCSKHLQLLGHSNILVTPRSFNCRYQVTESHQENLTLFALENIVTLPKAIHFLKKRNVDVVHIHSYLPYPFTNTIFMFGRQLAKSVIVTPHYNPSARALNLEMLNARIRTLTKLYQYGFGPHLLKSADAIIALTEEEEMLYKTWGLDKVYFIPPGVDLDRFNPRNQGEEFKRKFGIQQKTIILCVARLIPQKGIDYLLKAGVEVCKEFPNTVFVVVGEGPLKSHLSKLARTLNIAEFVLFTGYISEKLLPEAYAACDLFVLPSIGEPFGIVLLEAMASGKPIVATNIGGVREIMKKIPESLVPPADEYSLAKTISRFLYDKELASRVACQCREIAEKSYGWANIAKKIMNVYINAVSATS